jgi:hypothetical protein
LDVKQWNSIIVEDSFRDEHAFSKIQDQPCGNAQMLNDFQNLLRLAKPSGWQRDNNLHTVVRFHNIFQVVPMQNG